MCMVHLYPQDLPLGNPNLPKKKDGTVKHVFKWSLHELIAVACTAHWLPAALPEGADITAKATIGDYARWLKRVRNLVHPARYVQDHRRGRVTAKLAGYAFEVFLAANDHLVDRFRREHWADIQALESKKKGPAKSPIV